ncbi:retropepsin-like aspartic protease [Sphingomonas sp.]|jgi:predicted aspartyl protease|uniref:retropepsin-like aspartic protease n=1 Tax=Sphingomonas sp. TaxID=28214 RepID=UPI002DBB37D9|nr:retropepsin-like aspartic protease [Sphingomonas sp.]HEU4968976.1 retropepsin-like aspartic protease [Sphingomonas sp.]
MIAMLLALATVPSTQAPVPPDVTVALGMDRSDRMTVPVRIGESEALAFVIDTGAERTLVSRQLAERLNLAAGPVLNMVTVTGTSRVGTVIVPSLELSGTEVKEIEAPALDQAHLGAAGMLGLDSLQRRRVTLDFKNNEMKVTAARHVEDTDPDTIVVTARNRYGQLILVNSRLMGERVQVIVDTGAETSIGNLALLRKLERHKKLPALTPVTITSVTGGTMPAQFAQIERIQIGGVDMNNIPVAFADAEPFRRFGLENKPALLLGMDALRLFERVSVDFANKQVRFILPDESAVERRTLMALN